MHSIPGIAQHLLLHRVPKKRTVRCCKMFHATSDQISTYVDIRLAEANRPKCIEAEPPLTHPQTHWSITFEQQRSRLSQLIIRSARRSLLVYLNQGTSCADVTSMPNVPTDKFQEGLEFLGVLWRIAIALVPYRLILCVLHATPSAGAELSGGTVDAGSQSVTEPSPAAKVQAGLDIAWQTLIPIMPYIIGIAGLARVTWVLSDHPSAPEYPVYTWAFSTIVAAVWLAVRSREVEPSIADALGPTDPEAMILLAFLALWSSFLADSQRFVKRKTLYLLLSTSTGGIAGLLIAALTFIPEPRTAQTKAVIEYEHRTGNLIPLMLSLATSVSYILLRYCADEAMSDEEARRKVNDEGIAMRDLEAGVAGRHRETSIVRRDSANEMSLHGAVTPPPRFAASGSTASLDNFTLDNSITTDDDEVGLNGDVGLMGILHPNSDAELSTPSRPTELEN